MADVITPKFGGGSGGGDGPSIADLMKLIEAQRELLRRQKVILEEYQNNEAVFKSANDMLKLTLLDLIRTLQVNQDSVNSSILNLREIFRSLPNE